MYTPLLFLHHRPQNLGKKKQKCKKNAKMQKKSKNAKKKAEMQKKAENARSISKFIQKNIKKGKKKAHLFGFFRFYTPCTF